jgi:Helix-turn-helix domain
MTRLRKSDLLTTTETSEAFRRSKHTLKNMRWNGTGPAFLKLGGRVFYHVDDLRAWLRQMRRRSSSGERA